MTMEITPETPAMKPPNGVSNFVDAADFYAWTLGISITSMSIVTVAVGVRTYTKLFIIKDTKHEDYIAIIALVGFLAWAIVYTYLASQGSTRDLWNIRAMDLPKLLYLTNAVQVEYCAAMLCVKHFIIMQLKRLFCPEGISRGAVWWALQVLAAVTFMYYVACFFTLLFQCIPREKIWNPMVSGHCIDANGAVLSAGVINFILDLGMLAVPIWAIWHLQLTLKRKMEAISVFSVGFLTCGVAAAGIVYRIPLMTDANGTNALAKVGLWTLAEFTGTIVVGCMPVMPRFYEAKIQPGVSYLSQSLSLLSSSRRRKHSQSACANKEPVPSYIHKSTNTVVVSRLRSDLETGDGHEYIQLCEPSARR